MRKKIISLAMALAMVLSLLPGAAMAEDIALQDATAVGTVTVISSGGVKTEAEKATTVVFGNGATLYYAGQGTDGTSTAGRGEGFHAGIKMTIPSGLTVENNKVVVSETSGTKTYAKYRKTAQWWSDTGDGNYNQWTDWSEIELDGSDYMELWGLVNPNYFGTYGNTTAGILYNRYEFDWNADETADQTVYLNVTKEAKLMKDGQQVWPELEGSATQSAEHCFSVTNSSDAKYYITIEKAMAAAQDGATITLLKDVQDGGIQTTNVGKNLTFDFNNHTYACGTPAAGSTNTKSQGCQILRGNTVTMKNGTLSAQDGKESDLKTLIQNYGKLTLENMTLDGTNLGVGNYGGVGFPSNATFTLNSYNDVVTLNNVTIKNSENNATNAYSIGCGWWGAANWYPNGTQITITPTCTLENVLVYRDDTKQPTDVKSSITDGTTTISAPWTGDGCDVEYMYDKTTHKLIAKADVATLAVETAELTDAEKTDLGITNPLGTYEVKADATATNRYKITGSANYIEATGFNSTVPTENKGHYVALKVTSNVEKITVVNKSADAQTGKEITLKTDGTSYSDTLVVWLDGERSANEGKQFTISAGTGDGAKTLVFDFSDLVLLPSSQVDGGKITVTVDEKEVDSLGELLKPNDVEIPTEEQQDAPIKVEGTGSDKTLIFTGKDGSSNAQVQDTTAVTLPKALVDVVTAGDTKADVKVESKNGSVTIPSANLTSVTAADATVEITVAKATTTDVADVTVNNATDDDLTTIQSALTGAAASGVTVTATSNDANLIANVSEANAVTVVITGLDSGKTYVLLCVSGEDDAKTVTSYGEYTGTTAITVKSKHLTTFVPVEKTDANKDALAKVPADSGKVSTVAVNYTRYTSADEGYKQWFSGKLELTGLTANNYYVIQLGSPNGANRVYQVQQANGSGEITLIAQAGAKLWVFEAGASNTNLAAGVAAGPVLGGADGYTLPTA